MVDIGDERMSTRVRSGSDGVRWVQGVIRHAPTCTHDDLRACALLISGPVEEVSFLKVEKAGRLRADRRVRWEMTRIAGPPVPRT